MKKILKGILFTIILSIPVIRWIFMWKVIKYYSNKL